MPTKPNPNDPDVIALSRAILKRESGGNFNAVGDAGTSHGAGQWQSATWKAQAKQVLGDENAAMTPQNQKAVIAGSVAIDKANGLNPAQIAAKWNSGQPNGWENKIGVTTINGQQIKYNVPQYVKDVTDLYRQYKTAGAQTPQAPQAPETPIAPEKPKEDLLGQASDVLNTLFPAKNIGNLIGTGIAKVLHPEQAANIHTDATLGGVLGDVAQNALYFTPVGKLAGAAEKGITALAPKLAPSIAKTAANVAVGAGTGYGLDVGNNLSNNAQNPLTPGLGTALGVAAPLAGPVLRGVGNLAAHGLGVSTGVGANVIKEGAAAAKAGGEAAQAFKGALRGNTTPENIVTDARSALKQLNTTRNEAYNEGIKKIQDETFITKAGKTYVKKAVPELGGKVMLSPTTLTTKGVKDVATRTLKSIGLDAKGPTIDFAKRPSLDARGIQKVHDFVYKWDDMTPLGLNQLRQEVAGFRKGGVNLSPSDNRFNTYIDNLTDNLRTYLGDRVPQIGKMNKNYAQASSLIGNIKQGLSLGKNTQSDTAFRKLTSVLRTNNEFRAQLLASLEDEASRNLPEKIAGQQLSEILPRGLIRPLGGLAGGAGLLTGLGIVPMLQAAVLTSPRVVGETLLALGFTRRNANVFAKALGAKGLIFPAVGAVNAANDK